MSLLTRYRQKYFKAGNFVMAVIILCICFFVSLIFIFKDWSVAEPIIINQPVSPAPAPLPTEINANFLNQVNGCLITVASVYGYNLQILSGFRTVEEQDQLYAQGRTVAGDIITEAKGGKSMHNFGYAVDLVDHRKAYNVNWTRIGKIAAYCGLEQGDDGDMSHFEYRGGLTTNEFIAGNRPTPLILPCKVMAVKASAKKPLTLKDLQNCAAPKFQ